MKASWIKKDKYTYIYRYPLGKFALGLIKRRSRRGKKTCYDASARPRPGRTPESQRFMSLDDAKQYVLIGAEDYIRAEALAGLEDE